MAVYLNNALAKAKPLPEQEWHRDTPSSEYDQNCVLPVKELRQSLFQPNTKDAVLLVPFVVRLEMTPPNHALNLYAAFLACTPAARGSERSGEQGAVHVHPVRAVHLIRPLLHRL